MSATMPQERVLAPPQPCDRRGCTNRRRGRHGRFCSDPCRSADWKAHHGGAQRLLDFAPGQPLAARSALRARKPASAIRAKLKPAALNILGRLLQGPATWAELQRIGGRRYSARIGEIRAAGHRVVGPEPSRKHGILETTTAGPDGDVYELRA